MLPSPLVIAAMFGYPGGRIVSKMLRLASEHGKLLRLPVVKKPAGRRAGRMSCSTIYGGARCVAWWRLAYLSGSP